ncbi:MAG: hypothetical protein KAX49_09835 [Halanaerobiales bacterium]|nr:hypothetical protein [Halanaerobiales bacterium]
MISKRDLNLKIHLNTIGSTYNKSAIQFYQSSNLLTEPTLIFCRKKGLKQLSLIIHYVD